MTIHKMLLYPRAVSGTAIQANTVIGHLRRIALIGRQLQDSGDTIYLAGERFLQLITFLGCSPAIELDPPDVRETADAPLQGSDFCHVRFLGNGRDVRFRAGQTTPAPRCPHCRQSEEHWRSLIDHWETNPERDQWQCRKCGFTGSLYSLDFRKTAGFGRFFIEIWHIYPAEAVAGEVLINHLEAITACTWNTLYISE